MSDRISVKSILQDQVLSVRDAISISKEPLINQDRFRLKEAVVEAQSCRQVMQDSRREIGSGRGRPSRLGFVH